MKTYEGEGYIDENGRLTVQLDEHAPKGQRRVTVSVEDIKDTDGRLTLEEMLALLKPIRMRSESKHERSRREDIYDDEAQMPTISFEEGLRHVEACPLTPIGFEPDSTYRRDEIYSDE